MCLQHTNKGVESGAHAHLMLVLHSRTSVYFHGTLQQAAWLIISKGSGCSMLFVDAKYGLASACGTKHTEELPLGNCG